MDQESSAHPGSFQPRGMALIELHKLKTLLYPLVVIAVLRHSVGESALSIACQVDRRTAHTWLVTLTELGYLSRRRPANGYTLTPLAEIKIGEIIHNFVYFIHISDPTTTTDSHLININKDSEAVVVVAHQNVENIHNFGEKVHKSQDDVLQDAAVLQDAVPMDPISEEAFSALRSWGIGEPKRSALARLSWVTPDFINKWKTPPARAR